MSVFVLRARTLTCMDTRSLPPLTPSIHPCMCVRTSVRACDFVCVCSHFCAHMSQSASQPASICARFHAYACCLFDRYFSPRKFYFAKIAAAAISCCSHESLGASRTVCFTSRSFAVHSHPHFPLLSQYPALSKKLREYATLLALQFSVDAKVQDAEVTQRSK